MLNRTTNLTRGQGTRVYSINIQLGNSFNHSIYFSRK